MSNFSLTALLPGWLELIFFIYWTFTIVLLIMDDREPSITLAWLFVLVFLPLIGVFFYIFLGRDWKVVAQRKGWIPVSYTHLRAHETDSYLVCRLLLEKKKKKAI